MSCSHCQSHHFCVSVVPLFSLCNQDELQILSHITYQKEFKKKESIIPAHQPLSSLIILYQGKAKVCTYDEDGNEKILRILGPGDFFGELAILSKEPVSVFIIAMEDVVACYLDQEKLTPILASTPSLSLRLIALLAQRLSESEHQWSSNATLEAPAKLAHHFLHSMNHDRIVVLDTNKKTLASMLGMSAETLSRILSQWKQSEWVEAINTKTYRIKNEDALLHLK